MMETGSMSICSLRGMEGKKFKLRSEQIGYHLSIASESEKGTHIKLIQK
jgi:hypothetical protein